MFEAGEEDRAGEISVNLAEAYLELMTLPFSTQIKMGQMRNRFGLTNVLHEHDLPYIDRPDVLKQFFGPEGLVEKGFEATWVAPLPFFLEVLVGVFNGDNEDAFGRGKPDGIRWSPGGCGPSSSWATSAPSSSAPRSPAARPPSGTNSQISASTPSTSTTPAGWQHPLLHLLGE